MGSGEGQGLLVQARQGLAWPGAAMESPARWILLGGASAALTGRGSVGLTGGEIDAALPESAVRCEQLEDIHAAWRLPRRAHTAGRPQGQLARGAHAGNYGSVPCCYCHRQAQARCLLLQGTSGSPRAAPASSSSAGSRITSAPHELSLRGTATCWCRGSALPAPSHFETTSLT